MAKTRPKAGLAWEPPPGAERPDWPAIAEELRAHPNRWMKVFEHGRTTWATSAQIGHVNAVHPRLGFEFSTTDNTRGVPRIDEDHPGVPRTCTLFARWNPDLADPVSEVVNNNRKKDAT